MPVLTQNYRPSFMAVFHAADKDIERAAERARKCINGNFGAVAVLRSTAHLHESRRIASKHPDIRGDVITILASRNRLLTKERDNFIPTDARGISARFGHDVDVFTRFCRALGPSAISVRSTDDVNINEHIDEGYDYEQLEEAQRLGNPSPSASQLAHGTTATMALCGMGSCVIEAPRHEFKRVTENGKAVWEWKKTSGRQAMEWDAPDGAIIVMRTRVWDQMHPPPAHRSQKRANDGDPNERTVSIASIMSLNR